MVHGTIAAIIARANIKMIAMAAVIQSGENTHHQDQAIKPVILAITKMIVSHPAIPMLFAVSILALDWIYLLMASEELLPLAGCHAVLA
jgi:hypothetical protein